MPGAPRGGPTLYLVGALAGCVVGLVGGSFRWCLERADALRGSLLDASQELGVAGRLVPIALAAVGAAVACAIARRVPAAAGSGIQDVEAVWHGEREPDRLLPLLPAKFVGGVIAMGSGLLLGREGPTVHMGAAIGTEAGRRTRMSARDVTLLHTSLAGAGLAVAFTAPLGGVVFVLEEVTRTIRARLVLLTLIGTVTAVGCARLILGDRPVFAMPDPAAPPLSLLPAFLLLGAATGVLGVGYSRLVVGALAYCDGVTRVGPVARAAVIGAVVGLLLGIDPSLGGGGEQLSGLLVDGEVPVVTVLAGYLVVRFVAGPLSYAAGAPGGLFAPLLALGALWGALVQGLAAPVLPGGTGAASFAAVGMAALFAAVVRAPLTGVVLVVEMTGATALVVPLLAACFAATLTADRLGSVPIYDTLRLRMTRSS
ncbi:ClC family H(+)/Cl(-) exchange transporter [Streptomyces sp. Isolate_45]|uniref:ClC family H(+)/Cl(-) exchange transporter n=1 Tax=Streptomyces sp. Isolate_45 TaxID=2950111 RepID=UPI002481BFFF|nr:ClC family H(+)/Cl(-) exchange transporter [Streptomyces sp. Isolate_45]MDA5283037.1 ClC family H(+)/Cl(-) exchange transporter [Streptomyces sp. Isolate_45]